MPFWTWFNPKPDPARKLAQDLTDSIMRAARRPGLFLQGYAGDDFDGRFQMVAVHGALVMRRLKDFGTQGLVVSERLGEVLFDRFDYAYREEGVGDATIARKVRKLGERYFGLARALDQALGEGRAAVCDVLVRNDFGGRNADGLAAHLMRTDAALQAIDFEQLGEAGLDWPEIDE